MHTTTNPPAEKVYPAELKDLLERGNSGDPTAVPELKGMFAENPEEAAALGDPVRHAEQALLALAAGENFTAREAIAHRRREDLLVYLALARFRRRPPCSPDCR
jgi:hypothetical protein